MRCSFGPEKHDVQVVGLLLAFPEQIPLTLQTAPEFQRLIQSLVPHARSCPGELSSHNRGNKGPSIPSQQCVCMHGNANLIPDMQ